MNYSQIKPTLNLDFSNTKTLDPRINFRRSTPGAYYDGKTYAKAEENLINYSEDFSQWGEGQGVSVISSDNTAPDGSSTASLIDDGTDAGYKQYYNTVSVQDGVYFASIYVKNPESDGRRFLILSCYWTLASSAAITFDTLNETIQGSGDGNFKVISSFAYDVGNGWHRIGLSFSVHSHPYFTFNVSMSNSGDAIWGNTYTGSNQQLYIWGAQLEQRDTVTSYTKTDGAPVTKYQPQLMFASPDQPRFDHDVLTGESKGLLIEESRTNLIEYSEDFTQSFWDENRSSALTNDHVFPNQLIAPDGASLATKIIPKNVNGVHYIGSGNLNVSANTVYTASCYLKADEIDTVSIALKKYDGSVNWVNFNLTDVTTTTEHTFDDYSIEDVGNGWRRCSVSLNLGAGIDAAAGTLYFYIKQTSGWVGNNYDGLYMWGVQVEKATFPTSYIKTSGAQADRSADNASITGENFSSWYRQDEGSVYAEFSCLLGGNNSNTIFSIANEDTNKSTVNRNWLYVKNEEGNHYIRQTIDSESVISSNPVLYGNTNYKITQAYSREDQTVCLSGQKIIETSLPARFDHSSLQIGNVRWDPVNSTVNLDGHIKKLSYYPQRLTNEQLQQLTK